LFTIDKIGKKSFYWQIFTGMPCKSIFTGNFSAGCHKNQFLLANFHRDAMQINFYWQFFSEMP